MSTSSNAINHEDIMYSRSWFRCSRLIYGFSILFVIFVLENVFVVLYMYGGNSLEIRSEVKTVDLTITSTEVPFFKTKINSTWLENNPVYKRYYVESPPVKKTVTILVIVSTAPKKVDRRNAIRSTWWTQCVKTNNVSVIFTSYIFIFIAVQ